MQIRKNLLKSMILLVACSVLGCGDKDVDTGTFDSGIPHLDDDIYVKFYFTRSAAQDFGYFDYDTTTAEEVIYSVAADHITELIDVIQDSGLDISTGDIILDSEVVVMSYTDEQILSQNPLVSGLHEPFFIRKGVLGSPTMMALFDSSDADLGVVLHSRSNEGFANETTGDKEDDYEQPFAAIKVNSTETFVHEMGHLLGAAHDADAKWQPCTKSRYVIDYQCGYVNNSANRRTAMAYDDGCTSDCPRRWVFSNPNIDQTDSSGSSTPMGTVGGSYNTCSIYHLWSYVAKFSEFNDGTSYSSASVPSSCSYAFTP